MNKKVPFSRLGWGLICVPPALFLPLWLPLFFMNFDEMIKFLQESWPGFALVFLFPAMIGSWLIGQSRANKNE